MQPRQSLHYDTILYHVQRNDTLSKIIKSYYGSVSNQKRQDILNQIQANNPGLKNPDIIYPNQLLTLTVPPQYCPSNGIPVVDFDIKLLDPLQAQWEKANDQEKMLLATLAPYVLGAGSASAAMIQQLLKSNGPLLADMVKNHQNLHAATDKITRGAYNYRRKVLVNQLKSNLGPFRKMLSISQSLSEKLRISRTKDIKPTVNITRQINNMGKFAKYGSRAGGLISIASAGLACYSIANTNSVVEKNQIFVETLGSIGGGTAFGIGLGLVMMSTPVGWIVALVIGLVSVLAGYAVGRTAKLVYDTYFNRLDLVSMTGVSRLCRR